MMTDHLEIPARRETEHGLDVLTPYTHMMAMSSNMAIDNNDIHSSAVGVYQVEHKLTALGEAGQPQEEAGGPQEVETTPERS